MALRTWYPLRDLAALWEQMDRLFEDPLTAVPVGPAETWPHWTPPVDIHETPEAIIVTVELPGVREEQITLELEGKSLTIRGERVPDPVREGEHYHRIERVYGPFERAFTLGGPVDEANVRATYRHGVLEICLPRAEESRPRQIPVTVG